jgi:hypothetical protein
MILFLRVKWPEHGVGKSASTGVKVKNKHSYMSTPLYAFLA